MKRFAVLVAVVLSLAIAAVVAADTNPGDVMGPPQYSGGSGVTADTLTISALSASGRGIGGDGLPAVGFKVTGKRPFKLFVTDTYSGTGSRAARVDTTMSFGAWGADPYTLYGPTYPCEFTYFGRPTSVILNWAAGDTCTVELTPFYKLPDGY